MDIIQDLIHEVISEQVAVLENLQKHTTELHREAAAYSALAAKLEAERIAVQKIFEMNQKEKIWCYKTANDILDEAIKTGNTEFALIAMRVIEVAHSKTIFKDGAEKT